MKESICQIEFETEEELQEEKEGVEEVEIPQVELEFIAYLEQKEEDRRSDHVIKTDKKRIGDHLEMAMKSNPILQLEIENKLQLERLAYQSEVDTKYKIEQRVKNKAIFNSLQKIYKSHPHLKDDLIEIKKILLGHCE